MLPDRSLAGSSNTAWKFGKFLCCFKREFHCSHQPLVCVTVTVTPKSPLIFSFFFPFLFFPPRHDQDKAPKTFPGHAVIVFFKLKKEKGNEGEKEIIYISILSTSWNPPSKQKMVFFKRKTLKPSVRGAHNNWPNIGC